MSPIAILSLISVATVATSFISGVFGMAGGMMLMGVLLALLPLPAAMVMHGVAQLASNGSRAFIHRRAIDWRVFRGGAFGTASTFAVLMALHFVVAKPVALVILGLSPFVAFALPKQLALNVERLGHSFLCGVSSTLFSLTAGVAGPILDLFFVRSKMGRHSVVATKAALQSLGHLAKIAYFGGLGAWAATGLEPWFAAVLVVLAYVGTRSSGKLLEKISDAAFRRWTNRIVMSLGVFYLGSGIFALTR